MSRVREKSSEFTVQSLGGNSSSAGQSGDYSPLKTFFMIAGYAVFSVIGKAVAKVLQNSYDVSVFDLGWARSVIGFLIGFVYVPFCG